MENLNHQFKEVIIVNITFGRKKWNAVLFQNDKGFMLSRFADDKMFNRGHYVMRHHDVIPASVLFTIKDDAPVISQINGDMDGIIEKIADKMVGSAIGKMKRLARRAA